MYLSKMALNPARRGGRFLLGNPQAMHAAVMSSFPPADTEGKRVLWRVDRLNHDVNLYVVSHMEPDFSHVIEQAGWATSTWQTRDYLPLLERVANQQQWGFRLQANPVKQSAMGETKGKRLAHVTPDQQIEWLKQRSHANGFLIADGPDGAPWVQVNSKTKSTFARQDPNHSGKRGAVTLVRVQFDGQLVVTDKELFKTALMQGIGRAKAYGCGLLTIANMSHDG